MASLIKAYEDGTLAELQRREREEEEARKPKPQPSSTIYDYFDDYDEEERVCPTCEGWGYLDCHCGGDLCVCTYYGERPCPTCGGF